MSILSTNKNLIKVVSQEYSEGSGISIDDYVISFTGECGDPEVNSFVYDNSATIIDVNSSYKANSGTFLTAIPSQYATTGDLEDLSTSISETYQVKGDYLVRSDSANFYPSNNPSGFISGVDLSNYYTKNETSSKQEISAAIANIPQGDPEVNNVVHNYSANGTWLTAHQDISNLMPKSESANFYPMTGNPSGFINNVEFEELDLSSFATSSQISALSGAIDYVSANVGETIPVSNSGDLYKLEFNGVDLYGYKVTSTIPNYVYSAVSSYLYLGALNYSQYPYFVNGRFC